MSLSRWKRSERFRRLSSLAVLMFLINTIMAVGGTLTAPEAQAAAPMVCDGTTVYVQDSGGNVRAYDSSSNTLAGSNTVTGLQSNALGISSGGRYVYTINNVASGTAKTLRVHDRLTGVNGTNTDVALPFATNWNYVVRGAVNPATGLYYFSSSHQNGGAVNVGAYDPSTGTAFAIGTITGLAGGGSWINGDFAFTPSGRLIVTSDTNVYIVDQVLPVSAGNATLTATARGTIGVTSNGIAFGSNGHLFISTSSGGNQVIEYDLADGTQVGAAHSLGTFAPSDMASCEAFPSTLTLQKNVNGARVNPTDQFGLSITGQSYLSNNTATTTGNNPGLQDEAVGPLFVKANDTFVLTESAAGTTDLGDYSTSIVCVDNSSGGAAVAATPLPPGPGGARRWQITQPSASNNSGADVVCTIANQAMVPGIDLVKSNSGGPVNVGDTVTYTFTFTNSGTTHLTGLVLTDDVAPAGTQVPDAATLAAMVLAPGSSTAVTRTYVVTQGDVDAGSIVNHASVTGTPSGPTGTPTGQPDVSDTDESTVSSQRTPEIKLVKEASVLDGNTVGNTVVYTLVATNTGTVTLTDVRIDDPMLGGDVTPTAVGAWSSGVVGTLAPGDHVTATVAYTITQADVDAGQIVNVAVAQGDERSPDGSVITATVKSDDSVTVSTSAQSVVPPPPAPIPPVVTGSLPVTGLPSYYLTMVVAALLMLMAGAGLVVVGRRNRTQDRRRGES